MLRNLLRKNHVEIEPEEILLDKEAAAKLEIPIERTGIFTIFIITIMILTLFLARAFWLQIWQGAYYALKASENSVRFYYNQAPRGIVYDRNNKVLTLDVPSLNLLIIPADLPKKKEDLDNWTQQISKILGKNNAEVADFTKNLNKNSTEPISLNLNLDQAALIELETHLPNLPGLFISKETKRNYPEGSYFSHLIGHTGKVTVDDLKADSYYSLSDFIGKDGLEAQYEKELRGVPAKIAISVNSDNTVLKTLMAEEAQPGNNLILNIDGDLQKLLTDAIYAKMVQTNAPGAAAVVLDAKSGKILSLVSLPNFDNNIFNNNLRNKTYQELINNKNRPFFNRVISGFYPAGSTIKPFIASAALAENTIDPNYKIDDTLGYITVPNEYNPEITYVFHDWRPQGFVDMRRALAVSANVYFYEIGGGYKNVKGLGIDRIEKYLKLFGFGPPLGIDLPGEAGGLIPNPAWKKAIKHENWYTGDTYNVSIGQGDVIITPLQLVSAMAAVANGGTLWQPKIVLKITDSNNKTIEEFKPEIIRTNLVDNGKLEIVREGLRDAVTEGSVYLLKDLPIKVAGKTGTAQVYSNLNKKTNAWFTGFAPYEDPQIAIAIVIEGAGEGSTAAVPVAKEVFQWYYNQNYDKLNK
ncbi:penicillin-binding protein 2 [Candidatus Berkelbacteria bacterium CG_4_9_14_0_2_um_filter_42_30]|uniref:Penicillin-binding protein 2 n=1 Tax=Candidatus Berkelbacteria bacterium CG_4_9_14_0_2_um_filter_42_30 TaxID=1974506 RepID=A0A2M8G2B5_9BACT|nr:MAG: penicillin-binding protein 2 [Candidatus Berkelbacteria bacterium CG_4_9_14_0_2_um_filter_42_30]